MSTGKAKSVGTTGKAKSATARNPYPLPAVSSVSGAGGSGPTARAPWRFVVVGDTHVTEAGAPIASEMVPFIAAERPRLVLVPGMGHNLPSGLFDTLTEAITSTAARV